jgi:hypothetical protein
VRAWPEPAAWLDAPIVFSSRHADATQAQAALDVEAMILR